jgi:HemY protein
MVRIILFCLLGVALATGGAAWVAEQTGVSFGGYSVVTLLGVFVLALGVTIVAAMLVTMTALRKRGTD